MDSEKEIDQSQKLCAYCHRNKRPAKAKYLGGGFWSRCFPCRKIFNLQQKVRKATKKLAVSQNKESSLGAKTDG